MNWELAIKRNRTDLAKIIAGLFVLAGWIPGGEKPTFIRRAARNELARLLRVSEAALRRLIVIMATVRKYDVKPRTESARDLPDFSTFGKGKGTRKPVFNLIDPRKPIRFVDEESFYGKGSSGPEPRIWTIEEPAPMVGDCMMRSRNSDLLTPVLRQAQDEGEEAEKPTHLLRRLDALDHALKTLPRQARRMARLMEKSRAAPPGSGRVGPVRIGPPPGHSETPKHEADHVLRECHGLVCDLRGVP